MERRHGEPGGEGDASVDENGPVGFMVTKIIVDPQRAKSPPEALLRKVARGQELW